MKPFYICVYEVNIVYCGMENIAESPELMTAYATALLAKEKGFNYPCFAAYHEKDYYTYRSMNTHAYPEPTRYKTQGVHTLAPTQAKLKRWLREIHNIHICIDTSSIIKHESKGIWIFRIDNLKDAQGEYLYHSEDDELDFNTYELALEAALVAALKIIK